MKIALAGGTGFVGSYLTEALKQKGHEIFILTRNTQNKTAADQVKYVQWLNDGDAPEKELEGIDAFINLAGESINSGRWSEGRKKRIIKSRTQSAQEVNRILHNLKESPNDVIQASAIGYYGTSDTKFFTEEVTAAGSDFLAETVYKWEQTAHEGKLPNCRLVFTRFGIILSKNGGALPKMVLPYQFFAGGKLGKGIQWMSWIHIEDVVKAILYCLENKKIDGPVNFTAPNPVQMNEFGKTLGAVLHKPHWLPLPGFAMKMMLGEMSMLMLEGQHVTPKKLLSAGYSFSYPHLKDALEDIY
ncbi:TIGR01777 family oxidoreductase [Bacillus mesophilum]|uniref:TIGR01777 family protein n=1 Tax=Bacillus mesophilum TaxID=1071718 RepID=A0A7V7UX60_9BACI|nr:TIGR01777 family oxidoreductase [Bacillus mesophilum]KAB2332016.1 TIGR01777 family protein [Bacillus mesophilum]